MENVLDDAVELSVFVLVDEAESFVAFGQIVGVHVNEITDDERYLGNLEPSSDYWVVYFAGDDEHEVEGVEKEVSTLHKAEMNSHGG